MWPIKGLSLGLLAAAMAVMMEPLEPAPRPKPIRARDRKLSPNDVGPVIDTSPESKRARRRRLAKSKS